MTFEPNENQQRLIRSTEGIHLVDAGAGTGKTFTVTRRYATIIDQESIEPDDVLLGTFTENAAREMKERIVTHSGYGLSDLADAPIGTFHSYCHGLLTEHGFRAPTLLGIDDRITESTDVIDDTLIEKQLFREFINEFSDAHPAYDVRFRPVSDPTELLGVIKQLASKGVFPTDEGWYRNGERHLDGAFERFKERFDAVNEPRNGGSKQSRLRTDLNQYDKDSCYLPNAPEKTTLRGEGKQVPSEVAQLAFEEERGDLKEFVHDVYYEYIEFALSRNFMNYGFLQLFAFVLLCENHRLREAIGFDYVMIDEFQDTSEIQFKLALLLCTTNNVCVVGDWKQSIFSFQYAAIENITEFASRLNRFVDELNAGEQRVSWETAPIKEIELTENYRSTEEILELAERSLITPATNKEAEDNAIDKVSINDRIVSMSSIRSFNDSRIEAIHHEEEAEAVLTKIQEIVGNERYRIDKNGEFRPPVFDDIAVLVRTRDFGRELRSVAAKYGLPIAYEGKLELFRTDPAKLLLAWLRILVSDGNRGWAVVLEGAGYSLAEVDHLLSCGEYPEKMQSFKATLQNSSSIGAIARRIFNRYDLEGAIPDTLVRKLQSVYDETTMTRGNLIRFIERGIEEGTTYEVHLTPGENCVTVQTIHKAKGLEYPIVVLANMNRHIFPSPPRAQGVISFSEPVGLRQRLLYDETHGTPHTYDNWHITVLRMSQRAEYDEERRLYYVAMTRAKSHLVFAAGETPSTFFDHVPVDAVELEPDVQEVVVDETEREPLEISVPAGDDPIGISPHDIMREDVYDAVDEGRGTAYGTDVHTFAERYALGIEIEPANVDEQNVKLFIDALDGELRIEEDVYLPLTVDGTRISIHGVVDLVCIGSDAVEIIDFKTDRTRHAEEEYRKQLSVYYHVISEVFAEREVTAGLFYTADDERVDIDPLSETALEELIDQGQRL